VSDSIELEAAAAEALAARARLTATTEELRKRLDPETLLDEARSGMAHGARELAETAQEAARRRPGAVAGGAAVVLLFLLNRPIRRLFRRKATRTPSYR
jgi:hypothetical protein